MPLAIEASNPLDIDSTLFDPEGTCFNVGKYQFPADTGPCFPHKRLSPTLLATCRRVFIEAHLSIFKNERGHQVEGQCFWKSWIPKSRPDSPEGKPGLQQVLHRLRVLEPREDRVGAPLHQVDLLKVCIPRIECILNDTRGAPWSMCDFALVTERLGIRPTLIRRTCFSQTGIRCLI